MVRYWKNGNWEEFQGRNIVYPGPIDPYFLAVILIPEPHFPQNVDPWALMKKLIPSIFYTKFQLRKLRLCPYIKYRTRSNGLMRKTLTLSLSWSCKFYHSFKDIDELACSAGVFHGRALNNKFSSRIFPSSPRPPLLYFSASRPLP